MIPIDFEHPDWDKYERIHNWRNYVKRPVQNIWDTFTIEQKQVLAEYFDDLASQEEWD